MSGFTWQDSLATELLDGHWLQAGSASSLFTPQFDGNTLF